MQRYFMTDNLQQQRRYRINDQDVYHHLTKVLRAKVGQQIELVDHRQMLYIATIEAIDQQSVEVQLLATVQHQVELTPQVRLVTSPLKNDKTDWLIQKATELGVAEIILVPFTRTVANWERQIDKKMTRLNKIAQSAAEQSHRLIVPKVSYADNLEELILPEFLNLLAYEEVAKTGETSQFYKLIAQKPSKITLIVGPEGGITRDEVQQLQIKNTHLIGLGPRILRAETAPLYALSAISAWVELQE